MSESFSRNVYKPPLAQRAVPNGNVPGVAVPHLNPAALQNSFGLAYAIGAVYLFLVFSHATEFIDVTGKLHLVVIAAVLAGFAAVSSGKVPNVFSSKQGIAFALFTAFLVLGIPFSSWKSQSLVLYVVLDKKRSAIVRVAFLAIACILLMLVVKTGSRSSLIVVGLMGLFVFFKASGRNKLKLVVVGGVLAALFPVIASKTMMERYGTTFSSEKSAGMTDEVSSAIDSTNARRELMRNAVELAIDHPVFGIGLGNFANQSADLEISKGHEALWFTCHDIYLLVAAETVLIGFGLYCAAMIFCFKSLIRIGGAAKREAQMAEISNMAF